MNFLIERKLPQHEGEIDQNPTFYQKKMIQALADELTGEEYHELCHQLHGTKEEFDQVDGRCSKPTEAERYYYTVQSALYRGIFWQTLEELDVIRIQQKQFERAEAEWLEEPED